MKIANLLSSIKSVCPMTITYIHDLSATQTVEQKQRCEEWILALRSGKYSQGTGSLKVKIKGVDHFCCLGVACDNKQDEIGYEWAVFSDKDTRPAFARKFNPSPEAKSFGELPSDVQKFYGMINSTGFMVGYTQPDNDHPHQNGGLITLNDKFGLSFSDIANVIEIAISGGYDARS